MGEGYAAMQRGGRAACSGRWGQSDVKILLSLTSIFVDSQQIFWKVRKKWIFHQIIFSSISFHFKVSVWLFNQAVCKIGLTFEVKKISE